MWLFPLGLLVSVTILFLGVFIFYRVSLPAGPLKPPFESVKVVYGNPPVTYVVKSFQPWLEGDIAYNLYRKEGFLKKTLIGRTYRLYLDQESANGLSLRHPQALIEFREPDDDNGSGPILFFYEPFTRKLSN